MNYLHFYIFFGLSLFILSSSIYKYIYTVPFHTPRTLKYNIEGKNVPILNLTLNNVPAVIYQSCKFRPSIKNPSVILNNYINNSEFNFYMYDVNDQREYIKNNFDDITLNTFDNLKSYTKKSELWKYCILYKKGGIYLDTKYTIKKPLVEYIATHPMIFIDTSFIAVPPNLDIFKLMIDGYVNNLPPSFENLMNDFNYNKYISLQNDNNKCKDKYSDDIIFEFD